MVLICGMIALIIARIHIVADFDFDTKAQKASPPRYHGRHASFSACIAFRRGRILVFGRYAVAGSTAISNGSISRAL